MILFLIMSTTLLAGDKLIITSTGYWLLTNNNGIPVTKTTTIDGIIYLNGNIPPPTTPPDSNSTLTNISYTAAKLVTDPNKSSNAAKLSGAYLGLSQTIKQGTIPTNKIQDALNITYKLTLGTATINWDSWKTATDNALKALQLTLPDTAAEALEDISIGVAKVSTEANGEFLKFFLEVILPILLQLLDLG